MDANSSYIECRCGQCRVGLADTSVRAAIECLCADCRQRALISESRSDSPIPTEVLNFERGLRLIYFSNALQISETSSEQLAFFKLSESGLNTAAITKCCGTVMFGAHPLYQGQSIWVNADSCRLVTSEDCEPSFIAFASDAPEGASMALRANRSVPVFDHIVGSMGQPEMQAFLASVTAPIAQNVDAAGTVTIEELLAEAPTKIFNQFSEVSRSGFR